MLVYSKKHFIPTDVNMLTISAKVSVGYFYVSRMLYDQAVILHDMYSENPHNLIRAITGGYSTRGDVVTFMRDMPAPINILGPYLLLVDKVIDDLVDMVGAISVLSGNVNFRGMLKTPFALRPSNPMFSLSITEEYKMSWESFELISLPYDEVMSRMYSQEIVKSAGIPSNHADPEPVKEDKVSESEDEATEGKIDDALNNADNLEDALAALSEMDESYWDNVFAETEAEVLAAQEEEPIPVVTEADPVVEEAPVETNEIVLPKEEVSLVDQLTAQLG